jgi:hypothetical protein
MISRRRWSIPVDRQEAKGPAPRCNKINTGPNQQPVFSYCAYVIHAPFLHAGRKLSATTSKPPVKPGFVRRQNGWYQSYADYISTVL